MSFQNCKIIAVNVDSSAYHAHKNSVKRGDPTFRVSPSVAKEFVHCASRWFRGYEPDKSNAKDFGSRVDTKWLTPEQFGSKYAIRPATYQAEVMRCPQCGSETTSQSCRKCGVAREKALVTRGWNSGAEECDLWIKAQDGKEIVSPIDAQETDMAIERLNGDPIVRSFFDACQKQVLIRGEWLDEESGIAIPVECLVDLFSKSESKWSKSLGDTKCIRSASFNAFRRQVFNMGWHVQAAFNMDLAIAATGRDLCDWIWVGVENCAPFEPYRRQATSAFLDIGRSTYQRALKSYARCLKSGVWPSYDDLPASHPETNNGVTFVGPEPWMEFDEMSDQMEAARLARSEPDPAEEREEIVDFAH